MNALSEVNPELGGFDELGALLALPEEQFAIISSVFLGELEKGMRNVNDHPDAIQGAKEKMRKKLVRRWIREAGGLGLSVEEMLSYIQKEGNEQ